MRGLVVCDVAVGPGRLRVRGLSSVGLREHGWVVVL